MNDVRLATLDDAVLLAGITAAAFSEDPVMSWVFPDASSREKQLRIAFTGLVRGFLPVGGTVHLVGDACASFWRPPDFDYGEQAPPDADSPFDAGVVERFNILGTAMAEAHPHDAPHWYLNVLGTMPQHQGHGLGARVLAPVLAVCDAEGSPAYLESSNARNIPFYERQGFVRSGEIPLPGGPSLFPMWRAHPSA